jgi:thioredoxin 1
MGWIRKLFAIKDKVQPISVNDDNFETEVLNSDIPVLLDIWTPTCVHCDKLVPIVVGLANRYRGKLKVAEINGAEAPQTMAKYKVRGTPTVIYFVDGQEFERVVGFRGSLYHQDLIENELLPTTSDSPPFDGVESGSSVSTPAAS